MKATITRWGTVAALAAAGALAAPAAVSQAATTRPAVTQSATRHKPKVYAADDGWHLASRRPVDIFIGNGSAPFARALTWTHWGQLYARGHGELYRPLARPGHRVYKLRVKLKWVRHHNGTRFYSWMRWRYRNAAGTLRIIIWRMSTTGYWLDVS